MKARRRWTGWSRSRSAGSRSRPPRRPACGAPKRARAKSIASTSSTRRATSTSPSKSSVRCACSTARSPASTALPASSRSRKPCGARPTSMACRGCASSTSSTAPAPISNIASSRSSTASAPSPAVLYLPIGIEGGFKGLVDLVENRAIIWLEESLGAKFEYQDIPDDLKDKAAQARMDLIELVIDQDDDGDGSLSRRHRARHGDAQEADPQGHAQLVVRAGGVRLGVQEQGRPAPARRRRRLSAEPARRSRRQRHHAERRRQTRARRTTTRPSRRWRSRS